MKKLMTLLVIVTAISTTAFASSVEECNALHEKTEQLQREVDACWETAEDNSPDCWKVEKDYEAAVNLEDRCWDQIQE